MHVKLTQLTAAVKMALNVFKLKFTFKWQYLYNLLSQFSQLRKEMLNIIDNNFIFYPTLWNAVQNKVHHLLA